MASAGLSPEILSLVATNGPVQRKTNPGHVQGIVDYIVDRAEKNQPWAFNSIVLYSTNELVFEGQSIGILSAGEARAKEAFSVGEGLHRCLAWAVSLDLAKVKGVKRPEISDGALKRIQLATIPVVVVEEQDLKRQKGDFNKLNQQKPLTSTVLNLTDDTVLSELTRLLIDDVKLFDGRIDLNNASVGPKSDKLLSFSQLRFVVASYLLGKKTRVRKAIDRDVEKLVADRGKGAVRKELREVFTQVATRFGGLQRLTATTSPRTLPATSFARSVPKRCWPRPQLGARSSWRSTTLRRPASTSRLPSTASNTMTRSSGHAMRTSSEARSSRSTPTRGSRRASSSRVERASTRRPTSSRPR